MSNFIITECKETSYFWNKYDIVELIIGLPHDFTEDI